ncbi:MAG: hypothetical protein H0X24_17435 [Ktedonobacterales bacterium]|nr:hypothetical protein [Ktedonobacterales bacterium]
MRFALALTIAIGAIAVSFFLAALLHGSFIAPHAHACCTGNFYGGNTTYVNNATQVIYPEWQNSSQGPTCNCGVETAMAITNYADQVYYGNNTHNKFTKQSDQNTVDSGNQTTTAESQWGTPMTTSTMSKCGGLANISKDTGTDPRTIAYDAYTYTPPGYYFGNVIYRADLVADHPTAYATQVAEATTMLAQALETSPTGNTDALSVSVAINGGLHSVLVTGIFANNDPAANWPADITGIVYRDPQYAFNSSKFTVDYSSWAQYGLNPYGGSYHYSLWSLYYGDSTTVGDGLNTSDPEPLVGPYTPNTSQGHPYHWYHGWNWVQRITPTNNPDLAYVGPYKYSGITYPLTQLTTP